LEGLTISKCGTLPGVKRASIRDHEAAARRSGRFAISILVILLAMLPGARAQDAPLPKLDEVIARMEGLSEKATDCHGKRLDTIGWRVFSKRGARFYTQEMGLELLGRFERGKGVRTQVTSLGCADATVHRQVAGPNHYVVIHEPHAVTIAPIMLIIESPDPNLSFPHLLLRAVKGDPEHAEIDPMLVPSALENLLYVNEPIVQFQISPSTMFGHEPGLRVAGRAKFAGKDCLVLQSERKAEGVGERIPREWSAMIRETKKFFVDPATWLIEGMELDITRSNPSLPSGVYRDGYVVEVATRRLFGPVGLPEDTVMRPTAEARATGPREEAVHRTMQWQDGEVP
jgi:hypothetical protein